LNGSGFFEENPGNYGAKIFQHPFSFNNTYILIFIFSILSLCIYLISKENFVSRKRVAFILLLFILIFMQTPFTLSGFCVTHLFILYPIIQIILGLAVAIIFGLFSKDVIISLIVSSFFLGFFLSEVDSVIKNIYLHFKKTGGSGNISESIYSVNEYMKSKNLTKVVAMDWALKHNIIFLSKGGNIPIEFCYIEGLQKSHQEREKFVREIKSLFGEGEPYIYLFRAPEFMNHEESYDIFKKEVNDSGKILKTEKIFYQRDGRPSFYIYSVK
jgi:hypothetical protein